MKAAGAPQKLRFTILSCSGEDSDYPARELLFHSPQTRGWQSPRFCKYPQEILIKLEHPSKVNQIQILSHEFKVPTKVEIHIGGPSPGEPDPLHAPLKKLGFLSFDSNERSNHQARELKSVHINVNAQVLKLIVHRCHVNKHNIYNQVGLIALNLIGEPQPTQAPGPLPYLDTNPQPAGDTAYYNYAAAEVADLNLDIHVDSMTAGRIRELTRMKDKAVAREDYDEAKRLKAAIDRLKIIGQKVAQLELRKRAAVEKEDYDLAKALKVDIDKLRATGDSGAASAHESQPVGAAGRRTTEDVMGRVLGKARSSGHVAGPEGEAGDTIPAEYSAAGDMGGPDDIPSPAMASQRGLPETAYSLDERPVGGGSMSAAAGGSMGNYDERPAQGKGNYAADDPSGLAEEPSEGPGPGVAADCDIPPPAGWPADLPPPEHLSSANAKDAEPLTELAGEYVARAFYSRNWQLRDAALQYLAELVRGGNVSDRRELCRSLVRLVVRSLRDKVPNVFFSTLPLLQALLATLAASASSREVQFAVEQCVPVLVDKIGDNNARVRDGARDALLSMAGMKESGMRAMSSTFVKPVRNQTAWRPVLGALTLLQELVPKLGISARPGEGFELGELMDYVGKAFNSPNADVRSAAVKVALVAFDLQGPAVRKLLPRDINPKIKEQLDAAFGDAGLPPAPAAAPPPAAAPTPQASKGKAAGGGSGSTPKARHGAATPVVAAGKTPKGQQQQGSRARTSAAAGSPPAAQQQQSYAPDDPTPFLQELRAKEQQYGRNHPAVAEACSNLAILHNQRGEYGDAQPLYERALAIYESNFGAEHADVAHTLTDLAVLHLEQGRDNVGRPLLERALAIQEKALGPDHPDVMAIRDVLESD